MLQSLNRFNLSLLLLLMMFFPQGTSASNLTDVFKERRQHFFPYSDSTTKNSSFEPDKTTVDYLKVAVASRFQESGFNLLVFSPASTFSISFRILGTPQNGAPQNNTLRSLRLGLIASWPLD